LYYLYQILFGLVNVVGCTLVLKIYFGPQVKETVYCYIVRICNSCRLCTLWRGIG